jgi:hypothetical protein
VEVVAMLFMPAETNRAHLPWNDLRCDTLAFLNEIARRRQRYADFNACASADATSWNLHWASGPKLNHYYWIWTGKRTRFGREIRRPMTEEELHRPTHQWHDAGIARWRRGARGGPRPATVAKRQRQAKRRRVIICWELKSQAYAQADVAERIVADVQASRWPGFFMTLVTMAKWGEQARAIHNAGGQFALLAHGAPRPADLEHWRPYIDRIWGRFH